jgi:hypothetical protein
MKEGTWEELQMDRKLIRRAVKSMTAGSWEAGTENHQKSCRKHDSRIMGGDAKAGTERSLEDL